jgi:hypothetical protein
MQEIREKALKVNSEQVQSEPINVPTDNIQQDEALSTVRAAKESSAEENPDMPPNVAVQNTQKGIQQLDPIKTELAVMAAKTEDDFNIAPKKINWDLKTQVESKLEKLRRRTQKVIVEILREKLATQVEDD